MLSPRHVPLPREFALEWMGFPSELPTSLVWSLVNKEIAWEILGDLLIVEISSFRFMLLPYSLRLWLAFCVTIQQMHYFQNCIHFYHHKVSLRGNVNTNFNHLSQQIFRALHSQPKIWPPLFCWGWESTCSIACLNYLSQSVHSHQFQMASLWYVSP